MSPKPYKLLKQDLENVLAELENENIDLDEASKLYEQAKKIISELEDQLKDKQAVIKKLNSK